MSTDAKEVVRKFYTSGYFSEASIIREYLHPEMMLYWNARTGYVELNVDQIFETIDEASKSFEAVRCDISHLLQDNNQVTVRFTYYVRTIENPNEEIPMAHFIAIWEVKDGLMYRGYQMSQPAEEDERALASY